MLVSGCAEKYCIINFGNNNAFCTEVSQIKGQYGRAADTHRCLD